MKTDYFAIDTIYGERIIEFRQGDITKLKDSIDILIISAYQGGYRPTPGTMIRALRQEFDLAVHELADKPAIDLRNDLNTWVSTDMKKDLFFRRLMVVEIQDRYGEVVGNLNTVMNNIFATIAVAELKGIEVKTVVMPLLGTGNMGMEPKEVLVPLLEESKKALHALPNLDRIIFCERNTTKAKTIFEELNKVLKRSVIKFSDGQKETLLHPVLNDLRKGIKKLSKHSGSSQQIGTIVSRWTDSIGKNDFDPRVFGQFCRAFIENFVLHFRGAAFKENLAKGIVKVIEKENFAPWVHSYLHMIRVMGNCFAHEKKDYKPSELESKDLLISLYSLVKVIEFWNELLEGKVNPSTPPQSPG